MPLPERVLIDTSAFYALISATDDFHIRAAETYERLIDHGQELWTTSYIMVETIALVHRRLDFQALSDFMESISGNLNIFWIESTVHGEAWKQLAANEGRTLSFVDWTTVIACRMLGAPVFTFDRGLSGQGLAVLPR